MHAFLLVTALLNIYRSLFVGATADEQIADAHTPESVYLCLHNAIRSACKAQLLDWSIDMASKAQEWVTGTGNFTVMKAMGMFTEGLATFNSMNPTFSDFTQIIWQSTTQLGCASAQCTGISDAAFGEATMHVCLYDPVGNVVGELL
ncbi:hypothetical protein PAXRUDRAFT_29759 [Paxillus rubicundulus Ve08.2h10]|uniref:SCP domain-containing protein n=1 Tax=Paxillus rubicundulus Ve08.2h10 TaxID=930991 RepID=A0A0D0EAP1_9AGAM|nr:hypothetical protein PAXRUDRAFT_29759 [Paxillus rubicundulus Ve08.2h10]